jgi:ankyrin repeat protein
VQRDVRGILSKLPKTLDETYERVLRDIHEDNKEHARRLLHCLAVAVRPLLVEELAEILTFDFDAAEGDIPEYHAAWRWKDQEEAVLSTCSSLITIAEDDNRRRVVQFSHFSVKEFLMSNRLATPIRDVSRCHILPEPAHTILAQACLGFLLHLNAHIDAKSVKDFPLAQYAAEHWVTHAQFQGVASHLERGMRDLFDPHKPHFASWVGIHDVDAHYGSFYDSDSERIQPSPLYYSALCGFDDLAQHLAITFPQHVNAIGGRYDYPLVAALSQSHVSVAELLLEYGGNVNACGTRERSPLHTLLYGRDRQSVNRGVRLLLERGADVNARDKGHQTPLLAVRYESSDLVRFLLEHGADPNLEDGGGKTPLHILSGHGVSDHHRADYILAAQLLLERGAYVNARDDDHQTPLLLAMQYDRSDLVLFLLEHGADPNLEGASGKTPLHMLSDCRADCILVVAQSLLERGADVNALDKDHQTPLLLAARYERSDLVRFLLEHGADPNLEGAGGKTPLHMLSGHRVSDYHRADYILVAQLLLERGAYVNARDDDHQTPLLLAMQYDRSDLVRFLLEYGADPNLEGASGKTPLHMLSDCRADCILVVAQSLLERGADVNALDKDHQTPLLLAMQYDRSDLVRFLLEHGADPNLEGASGKTPLHMLSDCRADCILVVAQSLLERGADVNALDKDHQTPLLLAARYERSDLVRLLLEHGADPNLEGGGGETPLHILSGHRVSDYHRADYILVAHLLLERGTHVNARDKYHQTPLLLAVRHERSDLVRVLLEHGADPNLEGAGGKTPLHMLSGHRMSDYHRADYILVAQLLLERGVDVNARDKDHQTPLLLAVRYDRSDLVRFLLEHGADPNLDDGGGKTPLHILSGYRVFNYHCADYILVVAQLLLERGADVNARDKDHETPLLLAVRYESSDLVRLLLEHGANPNMDNNEGNTPLHTLFLKRNYNNDNDVLILRLLLEHGADTGARNKNHATSLDLLPYNTVPKILIAQVLLSHPLKGGFYPQFYPQ